MAYVRMSPRDLGLWAWCSLCNRVYYTERWRQHHWFCPGEGCRGALKDACEFPDDNFIEPAKYRATGLEELLHHPAEGLYYPSWLSPENVAHAGQCGRWVRRQGTGEFVTENPPAPLPPSKVIPGPGYHPPVYQWACVGGGSFPARQVMAVVGAAYEIRPLNPRRKRHQGRHCTVEAFGWDQQTQAWQALVRFLDDEAGDYVDLHDLWADTYAWDLSAHE